MKSFVSIAPGDLDEVRLREMLDLVGPASEAPLLQTLVGDLRSARSALALALDAGDSRAVCAQTHVLGALAGTFGAPRLAEATTALEQRAKVGLTAADGTEVLAMTEQLSDWLSARFSSHDAGSPRPKGRRT